MASKIIEIKGCRETGELDADNRKAVVEDLENPEFFSGYLIDIDENIGREWLFDSDTIEDAIVQASIRGDQASHVLCPIALLNRGS